jgi:hypothetical protein
MGSWAGVSFHATYGLTRACRFSEHVYLITSLPFTISSPHINLHAHNTVIQGENGDAIVAGEAFIPEIYSPQDASFYPICGHYFWDNNDGATTACIALGFDYGVSVKTMATYSTDAMPVGQCLAGEALDMCSAGGNAFENLSHSDGWCRSGNSIGVEITCITGPGLEYHLLGYHLVAQAWIPSYESSVPAEWLQIGQFITSNVAEEFGEVESVLLQCSRSDQALAVDQAYAVTSLPGCSPNAFGSGSSGCGGSSLTDLHQYITGRFIIRVDEVHCDAMYENVGGGSTDNPSLGQWGRVWVALSPTGLQPCLLKWEGGAGVFLPPPLIPPPPPR